MADWNDTAADYPRDRCAQQLFEEQSAHTPDAVAITFQGENLTYSELDRRANQLSARLRSLGVGKGALVGLCVERCPDMVASMLAILKSGAAYVPLDPSYPPDRVAFMLEDSRAAVLLTQHHLLANLPQHSRILCLEDVPANSEPVSPLPPSSGAEDVAYVIYTSGSTGKPKGVQVPHRTLVNFLLSMARQPGD